MTDTIIFDWCEAAEVAIEQADKRRQDRDHVPTPEEIRQACAAIQAAWSPRERHYRKLGLDVKGHPLVSFAASNRKPRRAC